MKRNSQDQIIGSMFMNSLPRGSRAKEPTHQRRRCKSSTPGSGRYPEGGHGNTLQYSCLENLMDRGAWRASVHRVTKNQTQLKQHAHTRSLNIQILHRTVKKLMSHKDIFNWDWFNNLLKFTCMTWGLLLMSELF